jgi:GABA permease
VCDRGGRWPDTVFLFLLNSSGAVILFVYLLIAISQIVLRRHQPGADREDWLFPLCRSLSWWPSGRLGADGL